MKVADSPSIFTERGMVVGGGGGGGAAGPTSPRKVGFARANRCHRGSDGFWEEALSCSLLWRFWLVLVVGPQQPLHVLEDSLLEPLCLCSAGQWIPCVCLRANAALARHSQFVALVSCPRKLTFDAVPPLCPTLSPCLCFAAQAQPNLSGCRGDGRAGVSCSAR